MDIYEVFLAIFVIAVFGDVVTIHLGGSLKAIENVADNTAESVVKEVVDQVRNVVDVAATVSQKINDNSIIGKIRSGVYDIKKGLVTGPSEVIATPVDLKDVTFYLVTAENVENPKKIDFFNPEDVARTKGRIIFLIHGWTRSMNDTWYHDLSEIFTTEQPDTHIVQVNWDRPANNFYPFAVFDAESVGNYIGILINRLVDEYAVPVQNIILIGHSLGSQVTGFSAKMFTKITGRKLSRIIALDAAGPLFILRPNSKRLNENDADVVMAIHTDAGVYGYPTKIGTIDFFPNGGADQPGCWKQLKAINPSTYSRPIHCDHARSWEFFIEAINSTGSFPARKCESYKDFESNKCSGEVVYMGDMTTKATGSFYLKTNSKKPFSRPLLEGNSTKSRK